MFHYKSPGRQRAPWLCRLARRGHVFPPARNGRKRSPRSRGGSYELQTIRKLDIALPAYTLTTDGLLLCAETCPTELVLTLAIRPRRMTHRSKDFRSMNSAHGIVRLPCFSWISPVDGTFSIFHRLHPWKVAGRSRVSTSCSRPGCVPGEFSSGLEVCVSYDEEGLRLRDLCDFGRGARDWGELHYF